MGSLASDFRQQMPIVNRWAYLDHAAVAPLPRGTGEAMTALIGEAMADGVTIWPQWASRCEELRHLAARLVGAGDDEIALIRNTTEGINLVAEGLPWRDGENVVTLADEFPSNLYPWMNLATRGVETRRVATDRGRIDMAALAAACDRKTRLLSVSWINFAHGYRQDLGALAEFARSRGILFFVDAIQGLGAFPLDVGAIPIDFLAADGHKWLLGPEGAGLLFVRREHLDRLRPLGVGWNSVVRNFDFDHIELRLKPTAARYEGGSQNMVGMIGLAASLDLLLSLGIEAIGREILATTDLACERLASLGAKVYSVREPECRSGIVSFELPRGDLAEVRKRCLARGVALGLRGGRLRISPHGYNNADDLDRLCDVLRGEIGPTV